MFVVGPKSGRAEWYKQILVFPRSSAGHLYSDDDALEVSLAACCPSRLSLMSFPRWRSFWHCLAFPWEVLNLGATALASRLILGSLYASFSVCHRGEVVAGAGVTCQQVVSEKGCTCTAGDQAVSSPSGHGTHREATVKGRPGNCHC
ncbi:hypothetical protein CABS01_06761 [Colletotrichum abscissum]|uniref:uncharacterized protein n=1 Tax=Colletotrichum abscissum TaxID=1671311 RepID=UPI0027D49B8D|nr:uncharacterized protein CABS01_06761 [Colletotrichum abscissum]KAK1514782.1 hypothetical protein CABS01_06761 [Colletotrichum abscissum]